MELNLTIRSLLYEGLAWFVMDRGEGWFDHYVNDGEEDIAEYINDNYNILIGTDIIDHYVKNSYVDVQVKVEIHDIQALS